jgi:nucleoside-diphosphate-sugar epimerase
MRVFITGASGHIGGAVISELTANGHEAVGLARSDASAAKIEALGGEALRGDLDDLGALTAAAAASDGVVHLAFKHEAMFGGDPQAALDADLAAIGAMADGLEGSGKPFVGTGGSLMLTFADFSGRAGTEEDFGQEGPRIAAENTVVALADRGIRSMVVRLSPTVHSDLDLHGFIPSLIGFARENGVAAYVGDGANRWPAVDTRDAAALYRLALEKGPAGKRLHGVAEEGIPVRETAEAIATNLGIETLSITAEQAPQYLRFLAAFNQLDNPTSNALTREWLGWEPARPGLIEDINSGHYFAQQS